MKTIVLFASALVLSASSFAQENIPERVSYKGKHELSPAVSFQWIKEKGYDGTTVFTLPLRYNYFITDHLGVGAELLGTFITGNDPGVIFSGRFEYCINTPGKSLPFISAGVGISNGSYPIDRLAAKMYTRPMGVLSIGTGIKAPISDRLFFRFDLQYRNFRGKDTYTDFWDGEEYTQHIRVGFVECTFGFSILL
jgi:hypothetical protein